MEEPSKKNVQNLVKKSTFGVPKTPKVPISQIPYLIIQLHKA